MNGYTNSQYTLPATCLDQASQGKLDADMVDIITYVLKFRPMETYDSLEVFAKDLEKMASTCGMSQVLTNLNADLKNKGSWYVVGNLILQKDVIESYIAASTLELIAFKFDKAGKDFGIAVRYMIPPYTGKAMLSSTSSPITEFTQFGKGLLDGFEGQSTSTGACYNDITKFFGIFENGYATIEKILKFNIAAIDDLIVEFKEIEPQMKQISSQCPFETLFASIIESLTTEKGLKALYANYYNSLTVIDADIENVLNCSANLYTCGKSLGNAIDILFSWNLEKASKTPGFLSF
eukprot:CAMPEP_0202945202 /NCGR_PEP_ID=MMETSP1395-20130829/6152_1 /ASSEMBLY_ACC=CAM_ASM_000871 /TAXON_ID=5961 /ORGANISM="Blepharisma japonicum, Strain Stock R1072" /LENGTH=292 /DNA_ID=CAMNT_0049644919 /DNA_START=1447 /DNA_END=2325 /DNA_ORIENTATION=+